MHECQGTAEGSIFLVISGEPVNSVYMRAWWAMPCSQAEHRCGAAQICLTRCFTLAGTLPLMLGLTKLKGPS